MVELGEAPRADELEDDLGTDVVDGDPGLRDELRQGSGCLDAEDVLDELEATRVGAEPAEVGDALGPEARLLQELPAARGLRILARIDQAGRQLPRVLLDRRPELPDDRDAPVGRPRDGNDPVERPERVIRVRRAARNELDVLLDEGGPRRQLAHSPRHDPGPLAPPGLEEPRRRLVAPRPGEIGGGPALRGPHRRLGPAQEEPCHQGELPPARREVERREASAVHGVHLRARREQAVHQVEPGGARQARVKWRVGQRVPGASARIPAVREEQGDGRRLAEVSREVERRPAIARVRGDELRRFPEERGKPGDVAGGGGLERVEHGAAGPQEAEDRRHAVVAGQERGRLAVGAAGPDEGGIPVQELRHPREVPRADRLEESRRRAVGHRGPVRRRRTCRRRRREPGP